MEIIAALLKTSLEIILSIQFGAFLITLGSTLYAPTGSRIGKFCLLIGFFIFTLNNLMIN